MDYKRARLIAFEATMLAIASVQLHDKKTIGEIVEEALLNSDKIVEKGDLDKYDFSSDPPKEV